MWLWGLSTICCPVIFQVGYQRILGPNYASSIPRSSGKGILWRSQCDDEQGRQRSSTIRSQQGLPNQIPQWRRLWGRMESPNLMDATHKKDKGDEQDRCQLGHVSQQAVSPTWKKRRPHGVFDGKDRRSPYRETSPQPLYLNANHPRGINAHPEQSYRPVLAQYPPRWSAALRRNPFVLKEEVKKILKFHKSLKSLSSFPPSLLPSFC